MMLWSWEHRKRLVRPALSRVSVKRREMDNGPQKCDGTGAEVPDRGSPMRKQSR